MGEEELNWNSIHDRSRRIKRRVRQGSVSSLQNKHKYNEDGSIANDKAPDFRLYMSEGREDGKPNTNTNTAAPATTANATSEEIEF